MTGINRAVLALLTATILFVPAPATTKMPPIVMLMGGAAAPKSAHDTIRLESQEVTIRLKEWTYIVDATFHFFNSSESKEEWVGFPKRRFWSASDDMVGNDFVRFEVWVDGRKTKVSAEPDLTYRDRRFWWFLQFNQWMVHHVTFTGHGLTTIRVTYEAAYNYGQGGRSAHYIYGTAVFTRDGSTMGGTESFQVTQEIPEARKLMTRNTVRYEVRDLKSKPDAALAVKVDLPRSFMGPK
jgi:hypothetical protein